MQLLLQHTGSLGSIGGGKGVSQHMKHPRPADYHGSSEISLAECNPTATLMESSSSLRPNDDLGEA